MFCFVERKDRVHTVDFITKVPSSLMNKLLKSFCDKTEISFLLSNSSRVFHWMYMSYVF